MNNKKQNINWLWQLFLIGSLVPLAFAPVHYSWVVFIGLFFLLKNWLAATPKQAFIVGLLFGLGFFGVGVSWVFVSVYKYGNTNCFLALLITSLFIGLLAVFIGLQCLLSKWCYRTQGKTGLLLGFPASWVLVEWLRGWLFTGFPWLYLGYSQLSTPLAGYAAIVGVYGVSFLVIFSTSLVLLIISPAAKINSISKTAKILAFMLLLLIWGGGYWLQQISWANKIGNSHRVSLVQGNLSPNDKFTLVAPIQAAREKYFSPSQQQVTSEFIIWPENSLTVPLAMATSFITMVDLWAKQHNITLILGAPTEIWPNAGEYYNTLLALGVSNGQYYKRVLVPFGEYLPLKQWLRGLINLFAIPMSDFKPGPTKQQALLVPTTKVLPLICYEIAYPELVRYGVLTEQSEVIITISEDGWFGNSWGPHQHLDIARMRALENSRYVLRSTTSGISAIIDEHGKIIQQSPQFQAYVLTGEFFNMHGNTPWSKYGILPWLLIYTLLFLLGNRVFKRY